MNPFFVVLYTLIRGQGPRPPGYEGPSHDTPCVYLYFFLIDYIHHFEMIFMDSTKNIMKIYSVYI